MSAYFVLRITRWVLLLNPRYIRKFRLREAK